MADQLKGRTIFITGSGGVLGSTYVRRMLAEGARVIASDLPGHRAETLKAAHGSSDAFRFYDLDVGDEEQAPLDQRADLLVARLLAAVVVRIPLVRVGVEVAQLERQELSQPGRDGRCGG